MKDKHSNKLVTDEIKQTCNKTDKIVEASPSGSTSPSSRVKIESIRLKKVTKVAFYKQILYV